MHGGVVGALVPLTLPTMVLCSVQWKVAGLVLLNSSPRMLVEPGLMSPKSIESSSITKRWITESLFLNITVSPVLALTGLGWNAPLPLDVTMATVMVRAVAVGVGAGAVAVGVGEVGVLADPPPPPQPHNTAAPTAAMAVRESSDCRMRMVLWWTV